MFFRPSATIDDDDREWQLECWQWLLENLGGMDALRSYKTLIPSSSDFPRSGKSGFDHAQHVFNQVAAHFRLEPSSFDLREQEGEIDPVVAPMAVVQNAPLSPLGTYSMAQDGLHQVTYSPNALADLEGLITALAHEICHSVLLGIPTAPPGGDEAEEFATDLAVVFFGFGIFGGNNSFQFSQYRDDATGTQGWSTQRVGYLTQNEWGFALAVRAVLLEENMADIVKYCTDGLAVNVRKNVKFLQENPDFLTVLE
ncbi:MAG: hypothetical protein GY789_09775 [Hyphomicrobiales bacterium]|nr:hypothetical protein [Hyphomicrobiales bacterium]MCP5000779.1 hypothetical protein [Hyphomicrobiales bacterium]